MLAKTSKAPTQWKRETVQKQVILVPLHSLGCGRISNKEKRLSVVTGDSPLS